MPDEDSQGGTSRDLVSTDDVGSDSTARVRPYSLPTKSLASMLDPKIDDDNLDLTVSDLDGLGSNRQPVTLQTQPTRFGNLANPREFCSSCSEQAEAEFKEFWGTGIAQEVFKRQAQQPDDWQSIFRKHFELHGSTVSVGIGNRR